MRSNLELGDSSQYSLCGITYLGFDFRVIRAWRDYESTGRYPWPHGGISPDNILIQHYHDSTDLIMLEKKAKKRFYNSSIVHRQLSIT